MYWGDWRLDLSEIIFPATLNQANKSELKIFSSEGLKFHEKSIPFDAVCRPYGGERAINRMQSYENRDCLLRSLKTAKGLPPFGYQFNKVNGVLFLFFGKNEGITVPNNEISSILDAFENLTRADDREKTFDGDYPFDFFYVNKN